MAQDFDANSTADDVLADISLHGRRYLITGISAGLGAETARALAARGADIVGISRDPEKARAALGDVDPARLSLEAIDLASVQAIGEGVHRLQAQGAAFDGVFAYARVMAVDYARTVDGFETQFAVNHVGHFVLVEHVMPLLKPGARVVVLTSADHDYADIDFDDPNYTSRDYRPFAAYGATKTANILFVVALDSRVQARGVRAVAVNAGAMAADLGCNMPEGELERLVAETNRDAVELGMEPFEPTPIPQAAASGIWAAVVAAPLDVGGRYVEECAVSAIVPPGEPVSVTSPGVRAYAMDPQRAEVLWELTETLIRAAPLREPSVNELDLDALVDEMFSNPFEENV